MKDFKSYVPPQNNGGDRGGGKGAADGNAEIMKILARAVSGKSEGQIFKQILAEAERGKRAGTLTNADLDNFYAAVSPLVDGFKRKKLKEIIDTLKKIE